MDRRTTLALALCMVVFAAFTVLQTKYAPKRPMPAAVTPDTISPGVTAPPPGAPPAAGGATSIVVGQPASVPVAAAESTVVLETPLYRATFSNLGARLVSFELKRYAAAHGMSQYAEHPGLRPKRGEGVPPGDRVELSGVPSFAVDLGNGPSRRSLAGVPFAVRESSDATGAIRAVHFTMRDSAGTLLRQTWRVRPDSYALDLEVETVGPGAATAELALTTRSWPLLTDVNPDADQNSLRAISLVGKDLHREHAKGLAGKPGRTFVGDVAWAGVQSHYFLSLVAPVGAPASAAEATGEWRTLTSEQAGRLPAGTKVLQAVATGTLVSPARAGVRHFLVYLGPADYFSLAKISGAGKVGSLRLEKAVDLGMVWLMPFSYPLLQLLRSLDGLVHNFGIAILLLASLVRLVLHPLNMSSMKSMRALSRLQPEVERLRDKYKNNAPALNTAMMALYKENNVNPAGGCLPMVLQMPLFFALYAVLFNAIDLRQAPFFLWVHDLSAPDHLTSIGPLPIRLLPIIMAVTGFVQQRLTPTDPKQAPTMYMMNAFMLFIFYNLPSGLVFYWTVMNLFTAVQQWLAMRGEHATVVVVPAAGAGGTRSGAGSGRRK